MAVILILTGVFFYPAQAQENQEFEQYILGKYGADHELINGIQYYNKYYHVQNHPYLLSESFSTGELVVSGRSFGDVRLNYDIHSQQILLEFRSFSGSTNKLVICRDVIDRFELEGFRFQKIKLQDKPEFFQVMGTPELSLFINWAKNIQVNSSNLSYTEYFTQPERKYFLRIDGEVMSFSNRRNFSSLFPKENRKNIRKYLRKRNIKFKDASPQELSGMLEYVSSLIY